MKTLIFAASLMVAQLAFAAPPPAGYPLVKGEVRKLDTTSNRISIKHEAIPNLNMPGITMSFAAQDPKLLVGLAVGDEINFVADEVDGDLTALWIEKQNAQARISNKVLCTGVAPTEPKTNVEIEVRKDKYSTIRYEFAEGSYKGTGYINSIGDLALQREGNQFVYRSGDGEPATKLSFNFSEGQINDARFSHYSSGMTDTPVQCSFEQ